MFWGGELYDDAEIYPYAIIGPSTRALLGRTTPYQLLRHGYKQVVRYLHQKGLKYSLKLDAISKIKLVGISDVDEAHYFKSLGILKEGIEPIRFFYYRAEELGPEILPSPERKNILVGNSAAFTNNHLEIFELVAALNLTGQQLVVPLGYSDNDGYVERLSQKAKRLLGNRYQPVLDFMDINAYQAKLRDCGYAIFNHLRQQALGTILMALQMGLRVFLNREGRNYLFFKRLGFHFNAVIDIVVVAGILQTPLAPAEVGHNRKLLQKLCSLDRIVKDLQEDLDTHRFSKT